MTLDDLARVLATPVLRYGQVHDAETARAKIEALFAANDPASVTRALAWFESAGVRQEWAYYDYYAPPGHMNADPRDRSRARKIAFALAHRTLGERGMVALDTMRACALAEWAVTAGWLSRAQATAAVTPVLTLALESHRSWAEVRAQLLLGLEFAEGEVDDELRACVLALDGPWPSVEDLAPASAATAGGEAALRFFALGLALDCPSCGYAIPIPGIVPSATCRFCGCEVTLGPEDWSYLFAEDLADLRAGAEDFDPIGNDYGARFFSRRMTREVPHAACACGAALAVSGPGRLACSCGRAHAVRAADALARAIDPEARLVVEALPRPVDPEATFACAACGVEQTLGDDPSRVRRCSACRARTYVDDAAHARSFDPPRRPTSYLVAGG